MSEVIRLPAERRYPGELEALAATDTDPRPPGWFLSPRAVERFVTGSGGEALAWEDSDGNAHQTEISRKFYGHDILVQRAIVTLASRPRACCWSASREPPRAGCPSTCARPSRGPHCSRSRGRPG